MKVTHFSTNDSQGGAARAAYRLHNALKLQGVASSMLVQYKFTADPDVFGTDTRLGHKIYQNISILDGVPVFLSPAARNTHFSPAILPDRLATKSIKLKPDLIHLHWIAGGFMRIETIPRLQYPIVWTLHDMWPFTGGCHYSSDCQKYAESCGKCPLLRSTSEIDLSRSVWRRKESAWRDVNLTIVTPSNWMAKCAANSTLLAERDIRVIPNPINTDVFRAGANKIVARTSLGLPTDRYLILFGSMDATSDGRKGFVHLKSSLQLLSKAGWGSRAELVVFGAEEPSVPPEFGMRTTYMGSLNDEIMIARLYSAADVFVAPSIQDNLPNTVMESLACGTPVVAFNIGGMPDMIEHEKTGWLSPPFDSNDMAQGIAFILSDHDIRDSMAKRARLKAEREYSEKVVADRHLSLYKELIEKSS